MSSPLTLDISNALLENLLEHLGVLKLLLDLGHDRLGQFVLLALLDLSLILNPRVKNLLGLVGHGDALLHLVGLGLQASGFLQLTSQLLVVSKQTHYIAYLGNLEELLGDLYNLTEGLDVLDSLSDGLGVVGTSSIQDILLLLDLSISPGIVDWTEVLEGAVEDAEETEGGDGFLVHHIELIADGRDGETSTGGEDGGLGNERVSGEGIDDGLSFGLGVLRGDIGVEPSRREGSDRGSIACNEGGPGASGACANGCQLMIWVEGYDERMSTYRGRSLPDGRPWLCVWI